MSFTSTWRQNETRGFRGVSALVVALLMTALGFVTMVMVLWPQSPDMPPQTTFSAGRIGDLKIYEPQEFRVEGIPYTWLVRTSETEVIALIAKDTRHGCTVPWRETYWYGGSTGWFLEPCHGSLYDMQGNCVRGPCPRGLDRFPVEMRGEIILLQTAPDKIIRGTGGYIDKPVTR